SPHRARLRIPGAAAADADPRDAPGRDARAPLAGRTARAADGRRARLAWLAPVLGARLRARARTGAPRPEAVERDLRPRPGEADRLLDRTQAGPYGARN